MIQDFRTDFIETLCKKENIQKKDKNAANKITLKFFEGYQKTLAKMQ